MAAQRKHAKVISSDIDITMTKTFFRQLCIYQKYYSHIQIRSHTPSTSWVDFNGISWKRVRWMTRLKQPHGTLRLFSRNRLVRWKADSKRTVVTWRSICVNNINKQQNTHGNKRFWQSKWKKSLILGRNGPFCVFFPCFVSHFVYFYSFEISCSGKITSNTWKGKRVGSVGHPPLTCRLFQVMISHQWSASGHPDPKMRQTSATRRQVEQTVPWCPKVSRDLFGKWVFP